MTNKGKKIVDDDQEFSTPIWLKPTPDDIRDAIRGAESGDFIDPCFELRPWWWSAELFNYAGDQIGDGIAFTPGLAMAMAWLSAWAPDALMNSFVDRDEVPLDVSDDFHFELTPPPGEALPPLQ